MSQQNTTNADLYYHTIVEYLNGFRNDTVDFTRPHLKPSFDSSWPFVIGVYAVLIVFSLVANIGMVYHVFRYGHSDKSTCGFLVNAALANVLHVAVPLPITVINLLLYNWIFGKFMCYFLPMLQDISIHVLMMTFLLIVVDRYRFLDDPRKPRIPAFICSVGTWFFAICIALPHPIYPTFLDLQKEFNENGNDLKSNQVYPSLCMANLENDIHDYVKSLFIGAYIAPLATITYMYIKSSRELKNQEEPLSVTYDPRQSETKSSPKGSNSSNDITVPVQRKSVSLSANGVVDFTKVSTSCDLHDGEYSVFKEARTQRYLFAIIIIFAVCLGPLMLLRLVRPGILETYDIMYHLDMVYLVFIWLAFLPASTTPCIYFAWKINRSKKNRWLIYWRDLIRCHRTGVRHHLAPGHCLSNRSSVAIVVEGGVVREQMDKAPDEGNTSSAGLGSPSHGSNDASVPPTSNGAASGNIDNGVCVRKNIVL